MQGTRLKESPPGMPCPGDYWKERHGFMCCTPDGQVGDLSRHEVVEHEDETITVSPSILVGRPGGPRPAWHGYLERGIWRQV